MIRWRRILETYLYRMILFKEIPDQMRTNGAILAQKTAEYEFLDNMTKTLIAQFSPVE